MGQDDQDRKGADPVELKADRTYDALTSRDSRNERRIFWSEVVILLVVAVLVTGYLVALSFRPAIAAALRW
ncbi:MAG: hypothetical protein EON94_12375 [Caulobacteraceae bacterium]|nr:MAG: hypothetical protein EON94_12375 [Caulobacteraceae bacterium]